MWPSEKSFKIKFLLFISRCEVISSTLRSVANNDFNRTANRCADTVELVNISVFVRFSSLTSLYSTNGFKSVEQTTYFSVSSLGVVYFPTNVVVTSIFCSVSSSSDPSTTDVKSFGWNRDNLCNFSGSWDRVAEKSNFWGGRGFCSAQMLRTTLPCSRSTNSYLQIEWVWNWHVLLFWMWFSKWYSQSFWILSRTLSASSITRNLRWLKSNPFVYSRCSTSLPAVHTNMSTFEM